MSRPVYVQEFPTPPIVGEVIELTGDESQHAVSVKRTGVGADISKVRLYTTGINDRFVAHNEYAHNDTAVLRINGSTAIVKEGVYKFWLVYDASPSATIGNTVTAKLDSVKTGNAPTPGSRALS